MDSSSRIFPIRRPINRFNLNSLADHIENFVDPDGSVNRLCHLGKCTKESLEKCDSVKSSDPNELYDHCSLVHSRSKNHEGRSTTYLANVL